MLCQEQMLGWQKKHKENTTSTKLVKASTVVGSIAATSLYGLKSGRHLFKAGVYLLQPLSLPERSFFARMNLVASLCLLMIIMRSVRPAYQTFANHLIGTTYSTQARARTLAYRVPNILELDVHRSLATTKEHGPL